MIVKRHANYKTIDTTILMRQQFLKSLPDVVSNDVT